jgi:outer membrane protein
MKRGTLRLTLRVSALLAALSASRLVGQQIPARLTLEEAQRIARLSNTDYRKAENDIGPADAQVRQMYGNLLPNLNTNLNFGGSNSSTLSSTDPFGRPISETRRVETTGSNASQGLTMGMTLFDGGANLKSISVAKASQRATIASIASMANALRARVARDYFNALSAARQIELEERVLAAREDDLKRTEKLLAVAASKYVDVLSARVQVATAQQTVERARGDAEKARLQLKQTLGVQGAATFELATDPPEVFDPASLKVDDLVVHALTSNPSVVAAEAQRAVANQSAAVTRGRRWPAVSASFGFSRSANSKGYSSIGDFNPQNRNLNFGLGVSLPVFTRFQTSASIAQADARQLDANEDLRAARLTTEREVRSAHIDLLNAYRTAQLADERAKLERERLAAGQEEYRLGGISYFQLQQYADGTANAERQLLNARFDFVRATIALEEKIGTPLER